MKSLITFLTIFLCIPFPDTDDFFFCALSTPCVDFDTNCIIYNHWATLGYWHTSKIYCEIFENNNIFFFFILQAFISKKLSNDQLNKTHIHE